MKNQICHQFLSPVGLITVTIIDDEIHCVSIGTNHNVTSVKRSTNRIGIRAEEQLNAYFSRKLKTFCLPIYSKGTSFQIKVWALLESIPYGQTSTYGELSTILGTSPRAVGGACGANPINIIVPCHRVISVDGSLVGFSGGKGCITKHFLLEHERI